MSSGQSVSVLHLVAQDPARRGHQQRQPEGGRVLQQPHRRTSGEWHRTSGTSQMLLGDSFVQRTDNESGCCNLCLLSSLDVFLFSIHRSKTWRVGNHRRFSLGPLKNCYGRKRQITFVHSLKNFSTKIKFSRLHRNYRPAATESINRIAVICFLTVNIDYCTFPTGI